MLLLIFGDGSGRRVRPGVMPLGKKRLMKKMFFRHCLTCFIALSGLAAATRAAAQVMSPADIGPVEVSGRSGAASRPAPPDGLKVVLLGTGVGPPVNLRQFGASTLVEAGGVRLLFDC